MAGARIDPNSPCLFCSPPADRLVAQNEHAYAISDGFPITPGHTLVIPRRHGSDYFDLTSEDVLACFEITRQVRERVLADDPSVTAFNVGVNAGAAAGQTVF